MKNIQENLKGNTTRRHKCLLQSGVIVVFYLISLSDEFVFVNRQLK